METRFNMYKVQPEVYALLGAFDQYISKSVIGNVQRELIRIRASQINGCAWCVNMHTKDARKLGETEQRIYLVSVWREAGDVFSEEEKVLLEMTEQVTLIHERGLTEEVYHKAIDLFGEKKTAQVLAAIITINAWNRIGVSLEMHPHLVPVPMEKDVQG
ncbi:MAG: carboxymuconolactone decarboxylase family protein [Ferruginibacter sp.]